MKYIKLLLPVFFISWLYSCHEETLLTYGEPDDIYFLMENGSMLPFRDSLEVSFMFAPDEQTDTVIRIPVRVMGDVAEIDRMFLVSIDDSSTAVRGTHYEIVSSLIESGRIDGNLVVKLLRTEELKKERRSLFFRMEPNEHFNTGFTDWYAKDSIYNPTCMKLFFTDQFVMPIPWGQIYHNYFGTFSEKKMRLIAEIMNVPLNRFDNLSPMEMMGFGQAFKRYLQKQKLAGTPVLEEDGSEMTTGPYA